MSGSFTRSVSLDDLMSLSSGSRFARPVAVATSRASAAAACRAWAGGVRQAASDGQNILDGSD